MKETLISGALKRIGTRPLERLAWAVDFAQRPLLKSGDLLNAELELTCFLWAPHLFPDRVGQIQALITHTAWKDLTFRGKEVHRAQKRFIEVLRASSGDGKEEMPLKYVAVHFTRVDGLEYVPSIPPRRFESQPIAGEERTEAKLEVVVFKLLQLLDQTVRANGRNRFVPLRLYVHICQRAEDGCGRLFAQTRTDQDYCCRTCVSRAQVRRFRKNHDGKKQKEKQNRCAH